MQELEGYLQQAQSLMRTGCLQEAWALYERAVRLSPDCAIAYNNLGVVFMELGYHDKAVASCRQAVAFQPQRADYMLNLACAYQYAGDLELALSFCRKVVDLDPQRPEAYYNWASVLREMNCVEEAIGRIRQALALKPDFEEARWPLAHLYLLNGQYGLGWRTYEWWRCDLQPLRFDGSVSSERWDGRLLQGQRLLVLWEQGFGDNLQFLRYLPEVKQRGATVVLEAPPEMTRLVRRCHGVDEVVPLEPGHSAIQHSHLYVPMLDLARLFGTHLQTIPNAVPYVWPEPSEVQAWMARRRDRILHIGLVWSGNPGHGNDQRRSCPIERFSRLWEIPELQWISLQQGAAAEQLHPDWPVWNWAQNCHDFAATAAAIAAVDLVISVDTAVLHLAGAMGKRTWALLPYVPDWRWHLNQSESPWYPSMRLFRQSSRSDWDRVLKKLESLLVQAGQRQTLQF